MDEGKFSTSELMQSAKLVGDAANSAMRHEADKIDKAKVADAAGDLLGAASHYGKLEKTTVGTYIDKAEDYLHGYGGAPSQTQNAAAAANTTAETHGEGGGVGQHMKMAEGLMNKPETKDSSKSEGSGVGGYMKMAEGLLNKQGDGEKNEGGGVGGYMKMAEGLVNKQDSKDSSGGDEKSEGGLGGLMNMAQGFMK